MYMYYASSIVPRPAIAKVGSLGTRLVPTFDMLTDCMYSYDLFLSLYFRWQFVHVHTNRSLVSSSSLPYQSCQGIHELHGKTMLLSYQNDVLCSQGSSLHLMRYWKIPHAAVIFWRIA